jgi:hypothetical protein
MGDLMLLPALLLPLVGVIALITTSRRPGGQEVLRRQNRYVRNRLILGVIVAALVWFFGFHTR